METRTAVMPEPSAPPRSLTPEDLDTLPELEEGSFYELLGGEVVVVTGAAKTPHQRTQLNLMLLLGSHLKSKALGELLPSPEAVILAGVESVRPDFSVILKENAGIVREDAIRGTPDLVVEILSPSTAYRDFGPKRLAYGRHGVREYWVVDVDCRTLWQFLLEGSEYRRATLHADQAAFRPAVLPDLEVPLGEIWPAPPA